MPTFTVSFDYSGKPPSSDYIEGFLRKWGYSNFAKQSEVTWTITTSQDLQTVESTLNKAVSKEGKYAKGKLNSVDVEE